MRLLGRFKSKQIILFFLLLLINFSNAQTHHVILSTASLHKDYGISLNMFQNRLRSVNKAQDMNLHIIAQNKKELRDLQRWLNGQNISATITTSTNHLNTLNPWLRDYAMGIHQKHLKPIYNKLSSLNGLFNPLQLDKPTTTPSTMQWGDFISNRQGLCLIKNTMQTKGFSKAVLRKVFGCKKVLFIDFKYQGFQHPNDHLDTYMNFIDPYNLIVSNIDTDACVRKQFISNNNKTLIQINQNNKSLLDNLALFLTQNLKDSHIKVHRLNMPFSCILPFNVGALTSSQVKLNTVFSDSYDYDKMQANHVFFSASNWIFSNETLIVPRYTLKNIVTSLDKKRIYNEYQQYLNDLRVILNTANIEKNVLDFPVSFLEAHLGGSARCLSLEYFE